MADTEKQVPEKPKKTKGMSLPLIIGISGGALLVVVVVVILAIKLLFPAPQAEAENAKAQGTAKDHTEELHEVKLDESKIYEDPLLHDEDGHYKYLETGRITTNPKGSTEFVVVDLGLEFTVDEEIPEELLKEDSKLMRKMGAIIQSTVTTQIGTRSIDEIHAARPEFANILKEKLKVEFLKRKMKLKDVILKEFIIQS